MLSSIKIALTFFFLSIPHVLADLQGQYISKQRTGRSNDFGRISKKVFVRNQRNVLVNPCEQFGSCSIKNLNTDIPVCYCDEECNKYNDCCFDASILSMKPKTLPKHIVCDSIQFGQVRSNHVYGSYLVSKCPFDFKNVNVATKCRESLFPVSTKNGLTYKNAYCAMCHNVTNYETWSFRFIYKFACSKKALQSLNTSNIALIIKYIVRQKCIYAFLPPEGSFIRYCVKYEANVDKDVINKTLCESFLSPLRIIVVNGTGTTLLKNVFCGNKTLSEFDHICISPSNTGFKDWGVLNLVGIFNVRPPVEELYENKCDVGYVYSSFYGVCVDSNCADILCEVEYVQNDQIIIKTSFATNDTVDMNLVYRILPLVFSTIQERTVLIESKVNLSCGQEMDTTCCVFTTKTRMSITGVRVLSENAKILSYINRLQWNYIETDTNKTTSVNNSHIVIRNCTITKDIKSEKQLNLQKLKRMKDVYQTVIRNKTKEKFPFLLKAEVKVLNDDIIEFSKLEFHYQTATEFDIKYRTHISKWTHGTILTYVTLSVSNVSLFFTVLLYKYLKLSRYRSGSISVHMMSTLLFAQLVFTFGDGANDIPILCLIIGIISHYLWLTAFTWVSIFLTNVLCSMRKMHSTPGHNNNVKEKDNIFLLILGYLVPFTIVLPCVILNMFSFVHIGYADGICFPTAYPANLFSFTLPILICLIINVFALSFSLYFISNFNNSIDPSMPMRKLRSLIPVYIRLSALCACPWVIGILADIFDSDALAYTFICLAGSQGTIVSICFLSSKNFLSQIKRVFTVENVTKLNT